MRSTINLAFNGHDYQKNKNEREGIFEMGGIDTIMKRPRGEGHFVVHRLYPREDESGLVGGLCPDRVVIRDERVAFRTRMGVRFLQILGSVALRLCSKRIPEA